MIGIYKITSPSKRVYVGQSVNIEKRFKRYRSHDCKGQVRLYASIKKYGHEKHIFEILCECEVAELNAKERYYQELYSCIGQNGLNSRITKDGDRSGYLSPETIAKVVKANTGRKYSPEYAKKMTRLRQLEKLNPITIQKMRDAKLGKKLSEEAKRKISIANKGVPKSEEFKAKLRISKRRENLSDETRRKLSVAQTGKKQSPETLAKLSAMRKGKNKGIKWSPTTRAIMEAYYKAKKLKLTK